MIDLSIAKLWAKTKPTGGVGWHPLILHMLDVAASVEAILMREPESTRLRMAACFGLDWEDVRPWLLIVTACHDLGKACPGFQAKWPEADQTGLPMPRSPNTSINHAFVSQVALEELLQEREWPSDLAIMTADAVGCHHGSRATQTTLIDLAGDTSAIGRSDWGQARAHLLDEMIDLFRPSCKPTRQQLSGPDFMLLAGLTSFADWIGSNEAWFDFGTTADCGDLQAWYQQRKARAEHALNEMGWAARTPLCPIPKSFEETFGFPPRPLQEAIMEALNGLKSPAVVLVEAPMGEGKTEAAFYAHLELQRRFGHRGLYVALPTKATGNAMFTRTLDFITRQNPDRRVDLQLLHGATLLEEAFQKLRIAGIHDPLKGGAIRAGEWFTHKKRALLSEYGVGTVDQALLPILPVRHNFVRLWGLANRVVVFDEIHAYDEYTGTLLVHLLGWLMALGSSVVLLSATLPPSTRCKLAAAAGALAPPADLPYPRLTIFQQGTVTQKHFKADPARRRSVHLQSIQPDLPTIRSTLEQGLSNGGMGLALVNTVQRAQGLYQLFPTGEPIVRDGHRVGKCLADGTEVLLFHARFPAEWRHQREVEALRQFNAEARRTGRKLLIATQVAEQSLDLDFDLMMTDLAPIDLILQRAGRLWRHNRSCRPIEQPILFVAGLAGETPHAFGEPLWWAAVYREDLLLRTWCLLRNRPHLTLPDEIDLLVQAVYDEKVAIPEFLQTRLDQAVIAAEGDACAHKFQAHRAIIGSPHDASWNDPSRFVLYDEDQPGIHRTLLARTRLGEESLVVIPIFETDRFNPAHAPAFNQARHFFMRAVSLSRKRVVTKLRHMGIPPGWQQVALLRNCYPMLLDTDGRWKEDSGIRLDNDLGVVYDAKEDQ